MGWRNELPATKTNARWHLPPTVACSPPFRPLWPPYPRDSPVHLLGTKTVQLPLQCSFRHQSLGSRSSCPGKKCTPGPFAAASPCSSCTLFIRVPQRTLSSSLQSGRRRADTSEKLPLSYLAGQIGGYRGKGAPVLTQATSERGVEQQWGPLRLGYRKEGGLGVLLGLTCPALQKERDREPQLLGGEQPPRPVQH